MSRREMTKCLLRRLRDHDEWCYAHSVCVSGYAIKIARYMGLKDSDMDITATAALLHDIGKTKIPKNILDKPGSLTASEYQRMKQHTEYGYKLLRKLGYLDTICEAVRDHHGRYDGSGYGERKETGIAARIICAADSYDAMKHSRPYKAGKTEEAIYRDIADNSGRQFEPEVCLAALAVLFSESQKSLKADGKAVPE